MATVRFVHSDFLRLDTPIGGLAGSPDWLRRLATGGVRQAVKNLIQTTIAQRADFLLIAGSVAESDEDIEAICRWLAEQFEPLRRRGIKIVVAADSQASAVALQNVCDVIVRPGGIIGVQHEHGGGIGLQSVAATTAPDTSFTIAIGNDRGCSPPNRIVYQAAPSISRTADSDRPGTDGSLKLSAGPVQSVSPQESSDCGCLLIEVDLATREMQASFLATDVIRFATECLVFPDISTVDELIAEISRTSQSLDRRSTRTVIVDWLFQTRLTTDVQGLLFFSESNLLTRLRQYLQGGHRGFWPRCIRFSEKSELHLTGPQGLAVEQYMDVVCEGRSSPEDPAGSVRGLSSLAGSGVSQELVAGLSLFRRAA
ncbi:MAG: hypothetical protein P8K08_25410 [Fuerstiella sp.]|jgi:hypothetical protein|nr:hypothetical protein [Fuerstiella sp.]